MKNTNIDIIVKALIYTINPRLNDIALDMDSEEVMTPESPDILPTFDCSEYDETEGKFMVRNVYLHMGRKLVAIIHGRWSEDDKVLLEFCDELQYYCDEARQATA